MKENQKSAAVAKVAAAAENQPAESAKVEKAKKINPMIAFFEPLIQTGQHTAKELLEQAKASGQFDSKKESTIRTLITDSKNPKYNRFPKLVIKGEGGKLSFAAQSESQGVKFPLIFLNHNPLQNENFNQRKHLCQPARSLLCGSDRHRSRQRQRQILRP